MTDIPTANVERPLSRKAQEAIEAHYSEIVELRDARDRALAENEKAKATCTNAIHKINALNDEISDLKGRCTGYQLERDEAVAKLAKLEGRLSQHIATLRAQIQNFELPHAPRQRVADDAEAPVLEMKHLVRGVGVPSKDLLAKPAPSQGAKS